LKRTLEGLTPLHRFRLPATGYRPRTKPTKDQQAFMPTRRPVFPLVVLLVSLAGCRTAENSVEVVALGPRAPLGDRPTALDIEAGETVEVRGPCSDTGALSYFEAFLPADEGVYRNVYYLAERRPDLDGELLWLRSAVVVETEVYGYALKLDGGTVDVLDLQPPRPVLPPSALADLAAVDLDSLSKHPEHNGDYRPTAAELAELAWEAVDYEPATERWLLRSQRLPLPPFADPQLERWLTVFALVDTDGAPLKLWVGVRGSFAE
jgi:hypothetical protein